MFVNCLCGEPGQTATRVEVIPQTHAEAVSLKAFVAGASWSVQQLDPRYLAFCAVSNREARGSLRGHIFDA